MLGKLGKVRLGRVTRQRLGKVRLG